jgi:hypothetical protein
MKENKEEKREDGRKQARKETQKYRKSERNLVEWTLANSNIFDSLTDRLFSRRSV